MRSERASAGLANPAADTPGAALPLSSGRRPRRSPRRSTWIRLLFLTHRYLGIGLGVLMVIWCLSGVVMIYVPYPKLSQARRTHALMPLDWSGCCKLEAASAPRADARIAGFQLEMLDQRPVLRLRFPGGGQTMLDLRTGDVVRTVSPRQALSVAARYGAAGAEVAQRPTLRLIDRDQWTVEGSSASRPLYKVSLHDGAGTQVYVSSRNGRAVQLTTTRQRFWNWLGAVPHWLYPTALRRHPRLWVQVIIWTSLLGTFLAATGIYIGIRQLVRRRAKVGLRSPYRGLMYWHHVPGLIFGLFALTWVFSGLLSVNPWGLMDSHGVQADRNRLQGAAPTWSSVRPLIEALERRTPAGTVSVQSARLGGRLFAVSTRRDGSRRRIDAAGSAAPLNTAQITAAAALLAPEQAPVWRLLTHEDAYHYSVGASHAQLPVIRVASRAGAGTYYYLDPVSGELVDVADRGAREYRWWESGLHRLDFVHALRTPLARSLIMLPLLLGAAAVCATGAWLGIRRLMR